MSGDEKVLGTLVCHVYRVRPGRHGHCIYLGSTGDLTEIEAISGPGGDWEEALVRHEDTPPTPPDECGLWEMRWPYRECNHDPGLSIEERERREEAGEVFDDEEYSCIYIGKPQWTLLVPSLAVEVEQ